MVLFQTTKCHYALRNGAHSWARICHTPVLTQRVNSSPTGFTNHFLKLGSGNHNTSEGRKSAEEHSPAVQFLQLVIYPATALGRLSSTACSTSLCSSEHLSLISSWRDFYRTVKFPAPQSSPDRYSGLLLLFSARSTWASPNLGRWHPSPEQTASVCGLCFDYCRVHFYLEYIYKDGISRFSSTWLVPLLRNRIQLPRQCNLVWQRSSFVSNISSSTLYHWPRKQILP